MKNTNNITFFETLTAMKESFELHGEVRNVKYNAVDW